MTETCRRCKGTGQMLVDHLGKGWILMPCDRCQK